MQKGFVKFLGQEKRQMKRQIKNFLMYLKTYTNSANVY